MISKEWWEFSDGIFFTHPFPLYRKGDDGLWILVRMYWSLGRLRLPFSSRSTEVDLLGVPLKVLIILAPLKIFSSNRIIKIKKRSIKVHGGCIFCESIILVERALRRVGLMCTLVSFIKRLSWKGKSWTSMWIRYKRQGSYFNIVIVIKNGQKQIFIDFLIKKQGSQNANFTNQNALFIARFSTIYSKNEKIVHYSEITCKISNSLRSLDFCKNFKHYCLFSKKLKKQIFAKFPTP